MDYLTIHQAICDYMSGDADFIPNDILLEIIVRLGRYEEIKKLLDN